MGSYYIAYPEIRVVLDNPKCTLNIHSRRKQNACGGFRFMQKENADAQPLLLYHQRIFLYCPGDTPYFLLKDRVKYERLSNPVLSDISRTLSPVDKSSCPAIRRR